MYRLKGNFKVYQANRNIKSSVINKGLKKDNKVLGKIIKKSLGVKMNDVLAVYSHSQINLYKLKDFRVSKNQKLNKNIFGVYDYSDLSIGIDLAREEDKTIMVRKNNGRYEFEEVK